MISRLLRIKFKSKMLSKKNLNFWHLAKWKTYEKGYLENIARHGARHQIEVLAICQYYGTSTHGLSLTSS